MMRGLVVRLWVAVVLCQHTAVADTVNAEEMALQVYTRIFSGISRAYELRTILVDDAPLVVSKALHCRVADRTILDLLDSEVGRDWLSKAKDRASLGLRQASLRLSELQRVNDPMNFEPYSLRFIDSETVTKESYRRLWHYYGGALKLSRIGLSGTEALVRYRWTSPGRPPAEHFRVFKLYTDSTGSSFMIEKR